MQPMKGGKKKKIRSPYIQTYTQFDSVSIKDTNSMTAKKIAFDQQ